MGEIFKSHRRGHEWSKWERFSKKKTDGYCIYLLCHQDQWSVVLKYIQYKPSFWKRDTISFNLFLLNKGYLYSLYVKSY